MNDMTSQMSTGAKTSTLPALFEKRWTVNFKHTNDFSKHDNYNKIQSFGEYYESGYGKKYHKDTHHQSNPIFLSKQPFSKRDDNKRTISCPVEAYGYRRRYPKRHIPRLFNANDHNSEIYSYNQGPSQKSYLHKKENRKHPSNSLDFESEMFLAKNKNKDIIASEPYKHAYIHPWKYTYTKNDYQTCTEQFRRVRSSNIDLSKY